MSANNRKEGILLESGTNEVEIIEFYVRGERYGVNVAKVKQIVPFAPAALSAMPKSPAAFRGVYLHRDSTLPLIDLGEALRLKPLPNNEVSPLLLICSFNMQTIAFGIDGVNRIHRLSWSSFTPLSHFLSESCDSIIGTVNIDGHEILIIDMEQIISEYDPHTNAMYSGTMEAAGEVITDEDICNQAVFMAEDSTLIRAVLERDMKKAGFKNLHMFTNGQEAFDKISAIVRQCREENKPLTGLVDLVVTDIEMPLMDGLTLCRKIKKEFGLSTPVLVYSSLINAEMERKCKQVGADAFFTKPNVNALMESIKTKIREVMGK